MRKLVLYMLLSLDGVAESPDRYIFEFDQMMDDHLAEVIGTQDAVLLGRVSYDEWAAYWPTGEHQPFTGFINAVPKFVFTSTQPALSWAGTTVVKEPATDFVRELKDQPGGDIGLQSRHRVVHRVAHRVAHAVRRHAVSQAARSPGGK